MTNNHILDIEEQYISPVALTTESLCGWIKWNNDADFEKIILRSDSNVKIRSLFDTDESEKIKQLDDGALEIPKSALELDGFFGFSASYDEILDSKQDTQFFVDFVNGDQVETISLTTSIDRPMIEIINTTCEQIILSNNSPLPQPISFDVRNYGDPLLVDEKLTVDIFGSQIKIDIKEPKTFPKDPNPLSDEFTPEKTLTIKGKGEGTVTFTLEYSDTIGNQYSTTLQEIPIHIEGKQSTTIPLAQRISDEKQLLLVTN